MSRVPRWAWGVLAVVIAAGLLAVPLGGWDRVDRAAAEAERLAPGEVHAADRFDTAVEGAEVLDVQPGSSFDPEPGVAYLAVYARLENATSLTQPVPSDHLVVTGAGELGPAESVSLLRDLDAGSFGLQPGLPEQVAFVWEVDAAAVAPGDELVVRVVDRTETESQVSAGDVWLFPRVGAVVEVTAS